MKSAHRVRLYEMNVSHVDDDEVSVWEYVGFSMSR